MSERKALGKAMMWNTLGNFVYCICLWVITILTKRLDSYGAVGYLSLAMTTSSTFSTIALFGVRRFQVSDVKGEYTDAEYLGSRVITIILGSVLCIIYAFGSSSTYQMLCINAFMLIRIAESAADVLHGIDQKYNRYDLIGKSFLLRGIGTVLFFVVGFILSKDILISVLCAGIINLVVVGLFDARRTGSLQKLSFTILDKNVISLLKKCLPIVITMFLLSTIPLLPKSSLQTMLGNDILGIYSSIASPTLVVQVFASYVFDPLVPKISVLFLEKRYDAFLKVFHKILLFFVGFAIFIYVGAIVCGRFGLSLLYGSDILDYYNMFMPLVWCTILTAYIWIMESIVTAIRKLAPMLVAMILGFALCWIFNQNFINWFGANGASYIQMLCFGIVLVILILVTEITVYRQKKLNQVKKETL